MSLIDELKTLEWTVFNDDFNLPKDSFKIAIKHIATMLRKKRKEKKITLEHLANLVGLTQPALTKFEHGQNDSLFLIFAYDYYLNLGLFKTYGGKK